MRFTLETPSGPLNVFAVHLETPREGLAAVMEDGLDSIPLLRENMKQRWSESKDAADWVAESTIPYIIAGDFNMPADSPIYARDWSRFLNAFSAAGMGYGHTKYTRYFGVRIDHILCGPGWIARRCGVGPPVGSDHHPVVADLEWTSPGK